MRDFVYVFVIILFFIFVLLVAFSDWGHNPKTPGLVDSANSADRFSKERFPETSGSGLKQILPQGLPPFKSAKIKAFESSRERAAEREQFLNQWRAEQQREIERRSRHKGARD